MEGGRRREVRIEEGGRRRVGGGRREVGEKKDGRQSVIERCGGLHAHSVYLKRIV